MTRGAQRPRLRGITKFRSSRKQQITIRASAELRCAFWSALEQTNPDVVAVNGWNNFGSLIAANCCLRRGIPMVVMSESSRQDEPRTWWKEAIKRRIVDLYSAALVGGQRHVEYLVELGMPRERVFTGYDVVDNDYFGRRTAEIRNSKFELRNKRGLAGELLSCLSAFHREEESLCAHRSLRRISRGESEIAAKVAVGSRASWVMARCGKLSTLNSQLST